MATKDWKLDKRHKNGWVDREDRRKVWLTKIPNSNVTYANAIFHNEGRIIFNKRFRTQTEALKYVKSYMRRH